MKKIVSMFLMLIAMSFAYAQSIETTQPKIMVMPYYAQGKDVRALIEKDVNMRTVLIKVREAFDNRGYSVIDYIAKLEAQSVSNGLSQESQNDQYTMILQNSGADICVKAEYNIVQSDNGSKSVTVNLTAFEAYTGTSLANANGKYGPFRTNDIGTLAGLAIEEVADNFLNVIQSKFNEMRASGRSIKIDIKIDNNSVWTFTKEINGEELGDLINDWMADNAYKNNFHVQGQTKLELIFDDVRIPLKDDYNRNYNTQDFEKKLRKYLGTLGLHVDHSTVSNTVVLTIK